MEIIKIMETAHDKAVINLLLHIDHNLRKGTLYIGWVKPYLNSRFRNLMFLRHEGTASLNSNLINPRCVNISPPKQNLSSDNADTIIHGT